MADPNAAKVAGADRSAQTNCIATFGWSLLQVLMEGYVYKKGEGMLGGWRQRYFILRANELQYGEDSRSAKDSFLLIDKKCTATFEAPGGDGSDYFYFDVNLPDGSRKVSLYTDREEDRLKWFKAFGEAGTRSTCKSKLRTTITNTRALTASTMLHSFGCKG
jgi:hypothetical protein